MKQNIDVNATTEQEIPEFQELKEILKCKNCSQKCSYSKDRNWNNEAPTSKWECEKEKKKIKTIEMIVCTVIEIVAILIIYSLMKNISMTVFIAIALVGVMIWFDFEKFDKWQSKLYKETEEKRIKNFHNEVEAIKANNEIIRKRANGETEEYEAFKNKAINLTNELAKRKYNIIITCKNFSESECDSEEENELEDNIASIFKSRISKKNSSNDINSQTDEFLKEDELQNVFTSLYNNLKNLTDKISPVTFEYAYIQKFYNVHLPSLIESVDAYCSKSVEELSIREKNSFDRLLETFDKKIEHVSNALAEQTENEFISKMETLQKQMLDNKGEE